MVPNKHTYRTPQFIYGQQVLKKKMLTIMNVQALFSAAMVTFTHANKYCIGCDNVLKTTFSLLQTGRRNDFPSSIVLDFVDKLVSPLVMYGCEIWGYENRLLLDKNDS